MKRRFNGRNDFNEELELGKVDCVYSKNSWCGCFETNVTLNTRFVSHHVTVKFIYKKELLVIITKEITNIAAAL